MPGVNKLCALLVLACALAGCGGGKDEQAAGEPAPSIVQPGAPGQPSRRLTPQQLAAVEQTPFTRADVDFMQGMIHHHAQALRMTSLVGKRSTWRDLRLLAKRIDLSQATEIDLMRSWLTARHQQASLLHRAHGSGMGPLMPGMLTEPELGRLAAARGRAFDRLFLEFMIRHHEGALTMVADLDAAGGGIEADVSAFVRHVDGDQQIEIARMQGMLARPR